MLMLFYFIVPLTGFDVYLPHENTVVHAPLNTLFCTPFKRIFCCCRSIRTGPLCVSFFAQEQVSLRGLDFCPKTA